MTTRTRNILAVGFFAVVVVALLIMAASCRSSRPTPEREAAEAPALIPIGSALNAADSAAIKNRTAKETEKKPLHNAGNGLFSFLGLRKTTKETRKVKMKNVTFQTVIGDGNKVASGDTKLKDSQQASDSATLTSSGTGNAANVSGDGNDLTQKAETQQASDWKATLAKALAGPVGVVLGLAAAGGIVYLLFLWRRKRAAQNIA